MVKHPKPHLIKHNGMWLACYGKQPFSVNSRILEVIAEGRTLRLAYIYYWNALGSSPKVENPFVPKFITTAWRRLKGGV